jgi:predicted nucleic acid-binding protein
MITFVDTNILLDVFLPDPEFGEKSSGYLERSFHEGSLIINEIVYAELAPQFSSQRLLDKTLLKLGIRTLSIDRETAYTAGIAWQQYRRAGGKRERIISDFLIGAHALVHADRLLTRDRGFYKKYFKNLRVIP